MDFTGELLPCLVNHRVFRCIYSMCVSNFAPSFIVVRYAFQPSFLFFSFLVIARLVSPFYGLKVSLALSLFARFFSFFLLDPPLPFLICLSLPSYIPRSWWFVRLVSSLVPSHLHLVASSFGVVERRPSPLSSVVVAFFRSSHPCIVPLPAPSRALRRLSVSHYFIRWHFVIWHT